MKIPFKYVAKFVERPNNNSIILENMFCIYATEPAIKVDRDNISIKGCVFKSIDAFKTIKDKRKSYKEIRNFVKREVI